MATVALNIDLLVDIPYSSVSAKIRAVSDSEGVDRTDQFRQFCSDCNLSASTQEEIEHAAIEFVKAHSASLS